MAADATVGAMTVDRSCADLDGCSGADDCAAASVGAGGEVDDAVGAVDKVVDDDIVAVDVDAAVDVVVAVDDVVVVTATVTGLPGCCVGTVACADDVDCRSRSAAVRARVRGEDAGGTEPT